MEAQGQSRRQGDGGEAPPGSPAESPAGRLAGRPAPFAAFPAPARRLALACLLLLLGLDLAVAGVCPLLGGDCLYGLFTLIAGPVVLAGLLGVLLPRAMRGRGYGLAARLGLLAAGGLIPAGVVVAGHVAAIRLLNGADYGGVLLRPRLLAVGLGLAGVYYAALAAIALLRPAPDDG